MSSQKNNSRIILIVVLIVLIIAVIVALSVALSLMRDQRETAILDAPSSEAVSEIEGETEEEETQEEQDITANWNTYRAPASSGVPAFEFKYPDTWKIAEDSLMEGDYFDPNYRYLEVRLVSTVSSGTNIVLGYESAHSGAGNSQYFDEYVELAPADFVPVGFNGQSYSYLGDFCVAGIIDTGFGTTAGELDYFGATDKVAFSLVPVSWTEVKDPTSFNDYPYYYQGRWEYASTMGGGVEFTCHNYSGDIPESLYDDIIAILASLKVAA